MNIPETRTSLSDLYKDCSDYLQNADHNMVRSDKESFADSIRVRHMEVRDIVSDAHNLGVVDADELFKNGTWMGDEISDITVKDVQAPFYNATVQTPSTGRALRADLPHHVNSADEPYKLKDYTTHLDGVVNHIRNAARKANAENLVEHSL
ncbi:MAG: hypothetical protein ACRBCK_02585 [Alphaproteobacteria bacterium]